MDIPFALPIGDGRTECPVQSVQVQWPPADGQPAVFQAVAFPGGTVQIPFLRGVHRAFIQVFEELPAKFKQTIGDFFPVKQFLQLFLPRPGAGIEGDHKFCVCLSHGFQQKSLPGAQQQAVGAQLDPGIGKQPSYQAGVAGGFGVEQRFSAHKFDCFDAPEKAPKPTQVPRHLRVTAALRLFYQTAVIGTALAIQVAVFGQVNLHHLQPGLAQVNGNQQVGQVGGGIQG